MPVMRTTVEEALATARFHYKQGKYQAAAGLCRQILVARPDNAIALQLLGQTALKVDLALQSPMRGALERLKADGFLPAAILDIGAYKGDWARTARAVFPGAPILMVEAQPGLAPDLAKVVQELGSEVDFRIGLLGAEPKSAVQFRIPQTPLGTTGSSVYAEQSRHAQHTIEIPMRTLDDVLDEIGERQYDFIKLDVQGSEVDVLRGGSRALAGSEVVLLEASLAEYNCGAPLLHEVVAFMAKAGFVAHDTAGESRRSESSVLQLDMLFVPKESPLRQAWLRR